MNSRKSSISSVRFQPGASPLKRSFTFSGTENSVTKNARQSLKKLLSDAKTQPIRHMSALELHGSGAVHNHMLLLVPVALGAAFLLLFRPYIWSLIGSPIEGTRL